jgi:hypothetical protein
VLVACLAALSPAFAGPIAVDAGWYGFCFDGPGSAAYAGCQNRGAGTEGNTFTFTALGPVLFKITDAFYQGDTFLVNIDGAAISFTTPTVPSGSGSVSDPDLAFADPTYSHSWVLLGAGAHSVDVFAAASPHGAGGAYLEVETAIPEPSTFALLGGGLLLAGLLRRRLAR